MSLRGIIGVLTCHNVVETPHCLWVSSHNSFISCIVAYIISRLLPVWHYSSKGTFCHFRDSELQFSFYYLLKPYHRKHLILLIDTLCKYFWSTLVVSKPRPAILNEVRLIFINIYQQWIFMIIYRFIAGINLPLTKSRKAVILLFACIQDTSNVIDLVEICGYDSMNSCVNFEVTHSMVWWDTQKECFICQKLPIKWK